ncbi:MAG: 50S ribosomal protein L10 [Holosporales bacterium]|jgi:large subunit ribosomal protein L10|nr:50S ribosomal protein L10 [Holosporales bacterium]
MNRLQKEELISGVRSELSNMSLVVVARQKGITVASSTKLRRDVREVNAKVKVLKNTLLGIAIDGTHLSGLKSFLGGPVMLAYSTEPVGVAKVLANFASENEGKLEIIGGILDGKVLDAGSVRLLAKLPSLNELRAKLVGLVMAPATKVVRTVKEPVARVARVVGEKGRATA